MGRCLKGGYRPYGFFPSLKAAKSLALAKALRNFLFGRGPGGWRNYRALPVRLALGIVGGPTGRFTLSTPARRERGTAAQIQGPRADEGTCKRFRRPSLVLGAGLFAFKTGTRARTNLNGRLFRVLTAAPKNCFYYPLRGQETSRSFTSSRVFSCSPARGACEGPRLVGRFRG